MILACDNSVDDGSSNLIKNKKKTNAFIFNSGRYKIKKK